MLLAESQIQFLQKGALVKQRHLFFVQMKICIAGAICLYENDRDFVLDLVESFISLKSQEQVHYVRISDSPR